jgi:hypothetical protein
MMLNWKYWEHSKCPCCQHEREDKHHLLTCPHEDCAETWHNSLLGLEAWMLETDTAPEIRDCLLQTLATRNPTQLFTALCPPSALREHSRRTGLVGCTRPMARYPNSGGAFRRRITALSILAGPRRNGPRDLSLTSSL